MWIVGEAGYPESKTETAKVMYSLPWDHQPRFPEKWSSSPCLFPSSHLLSHACWSWVTFILHGLLFDIKPPEISNTALLATHLWNYFSWKKVVHSLFVLLNKTWSSRNINCKFNYIYYYFQSPYLALNSYIKAIWKAELSCWVLIIFKRFGSYSPCVWWDIFLS